MTQIDIIEEAKRVIDIEISQIRKVRELINNDFASIIHLLFNCSGKVIVTGVGKSGLIGRKIASTLSSTGTLAVFLHPGEGIHGDLGIVKRLDIILLISKSGETDEILALLPSLRKIGCTIVSIVGNPYSTLAKNSDYFINASIEREACPLNLAPTCSTTVTLVLGDAIATILTKLRGFRPMDFALFHPGGNLGKKLLLRVGDVMHSGDENPVTNENTLMRDVLVDMTRKAMGAISVVDGRSRLVGVITDGDLRRAIQKEDKLLTMSAKEIMTGDPITITKDAMAIDALELMENRPSQIMVLPVVNEDNIPIGMVRVHDLVKAGLQPEGNISSKGHVS